jgi:hypothetical protein
LLIYNTVHITDYFQFIFSMLPPDFSNQPTYFNNGSKRKNNKKRKNTKNSGLPKFAPLVAHISLGPTILS